MGERLLLLTHVGRVSSEERETVIDVVAKDEKRDAYYVVSAWGGAGRLAEKYPEKSAMHYPGRR